MNQTHEKSPKPLGEKKKRKKNRKKVSQLYDTKIFADYSAISLNKNDKMMSPFFHLDHPLQVEAYISSPSQLKSIETKRN